MSQIANPLEPMSRYRLRFVFTALLLIPSLIASEKADDAMQKHSIRFLQYRIEFALPPGSQEPRGKIPDQIDATNLPHQGSVYQFVTERYPFGRRFHFEEDGSIFVEGVVLRRSEKQIALAESRLDVNALKQSLDTSDTLKEATTELTTLSGIRCVKRSLDAVASDGSSCSREQSWHVPLTEDVLLTFRVSFSWKRPLNDPKTKDSRLYADALARKIFEYLVVKSEAAKENAPARKSAAR